MMQLKFYNIKIFLAVFLLVFVFIGFFSVFQAEASSVIDDLKKEISLYNEKIKNLEKETKKYKDSLYKTNREKKTLKSQIYSLENEIYYLNTNIKKTQNELIETSLSINLLDEEIKEKNQNIKDLKNQMKMTLRLIYEKNNTSLFSLMLSARTFSQILSQKEYLNNLEREITSSLDKIKILKSELEKDKTLQENKKIELLKLNEKYLDQQEITRYKKSEKDKLLKDTKNKEYKYQKILASLNKQRKSIEGEIGILEKKLKEAIDRSKLPKGKGMFRYPLDHIRVTQGYGMTSYAKTGAYNGNGHNGVDLGGASGTPIKAALGGEVIGVGNNGRYAYGKWVAIRHDNGLVTLYAHMSLQKVKKGERVDMGQLIGYVGATGYVTGPHLHFTVYAPGSFGLRQSSVVSWLKIPYGAPLNPFDYL